MMKQTIRIRVLRPDGEVLHMVHQHPQALKLGYQVDRRYYVRRGIEPIEPPYTIEIEVPACEDYRMEDKKL